MNRNVGELDSIVRIVFGAALVPNLIFTKGMGKILGVLGIALLASGKTKKCELYNAIGTSTYTAE
ncbi:YgaP family membrane protein [Marinilactibacillus kalidii]|uniref:YgaP family membrane protein n=1 Tax=Marinilactibacillus kalidii TaxID=2820274 RepID=UPI001ABE137F|nr:DUF2892 domain-containing protein [Marinilactibacillus kalidii]